MTYTLPRVGQLVQVTGTEGPMEATVTRVYVAHGRAVDLRIDTLGGPIAMYGVLYSDLPSVGTWRWLPPPPSTKEGA